ncbi:MAG TPA: NapC/NirT family cytochrome c [Candidatus Xenobia bacterium]|nr:NapC/NirT family cytochrome c [Candidatus Xenobia bacterium]
MILTGLPGRLLRPVFYLGNNRLSQFGVVLTTSSAVTLISFYTTDFFGIHVSPYWGIIGYLMLPGVFVFGLLLIPAGIWRRYRSEKGAGALPLEYPQIDLRDPRLRETLLFVLIMTGINLIIFLTASYKGVHYMDSVQFCGQTCHSVMQPEYTAYLNSPHARVPCVECHIGPGAPWFVRSKLSGAYQVISVNLNLYSRPIPTPIENLRPSRETCEQCHWPLKFVGDRVVVKPKFAEDEANTATKTVLLMHIGGLDPLTQEPRGNHGVHLQPGSRIEYVAADHARQEIPYVRYQKPNGEVLEFVSSDKPIDELRRGELRLMDCMDCHNRPTHTFQMPDAAVNQALAAGVVDPSLPWIKKQSMAVLQKEYASHEAAAQEIPQQLREFYRAHYPEVFESRRPVIDRSAQTLVGIYQRNVFPQMKISWGTYPNNLGHNAFPGCFRCHDGAHTTPDGSVSIPSDCSTCHSLLAVEEPNPPILESLRVN